MVTAASPEEQARSLLAAGRAWANRFDRPDLLARIEAALDRLDSPSCQVVVLGEFKKGKSSLLNALLNVRVCPTDADIATAVPNHLRFGETFEIRTLGNDLSASGAVVGGAEADGAARGAAGTGVRALEMYLPRELLAAGIVLVDTPGVGGGLASSHAATALRALARADVVLFVADAGSEYSAPELDLLAQAVKICPNVLCVLTKVDIYPEAARILAADRAHLDRIGVHAPLLPISSPLRQVGLRELDDALIVESGFPELTVALLDAVDVSAGSGQVAAAAATAAVLGQVRAELNARKRRLTGSADDVARREAAVVARKRVQELRSVGSRWQQTLNDRLDDLYGEIELDLTQRLRGLRRDAADHIANTHPSRLGADLGPWLQQRTNEVLIGHVRRLQDEIEAVADAVADQFGSASWELRSGMDLDTLRPDGSAGSAAEFGRGSALDRRMTKFEVGLAALRGGATGAMVTHAIGLVVGIAVPVVIPAAIALSAALGGKSWQTARSGQLRGIRAEAERAVGTYLEEVDSVARKDSRDALRRTRRHLRDTFGSRAAELLVTVTRAADAVDAAETGDVAARAAEIAVLETDLAQLTTVMSASRSLVDRLTQ